ncbi:MAG: site-specific integrase [Microbacterium sp.]|jgi:integrase|uniref:Putative prophage phiRv2 integrase n=1 Tax=Microbacterium ginsengisoli TaxID=400772 RepID=A0A0F0LVX6_9MICO|nr:site-specific integrase [Microbacterium ginsengisoli]KJL37843.1 putative prophage phiRv2 integrase [Microbacterium ginsengisoli]MAL07212.1 site-specific integrase [Microbacterium sp.]MBN9208816.1 site-specific integrase [Microbacterium ginsengisoli]HAN25208.1 site-specific integrase [Microbacterium ginsengisoli]
MSIQVVINAQGKKRYRAKPKVGRIVIASKTFDRRKDAEAWHDAQLRAYHLGSFVHPKAGNEKFGAVLDRWRAAREGTIGVKTYRNEGYALKHVDALRNRPIAALDKGEWEALYAKLLRTTARSTVLRFRDSMSALYEWAVGENIVPANVIRASRVPRGTAERATREIFPYNLAELRAVYAAMAERTTKSNADILLVLGLTGLRWGELSALRVRDVQELPYPALRPSRSKSDGAPLRTITKGGQPRTVPMSEDVAAMVFLLIDGRGPNELVFPSTVGSFRAENNWKRDSHWDDVKRGRRVHDLRHTFATLALSNGVDIKTVQNWLGHSTAKLTLDTYGHYMHSDADTAGIARLNDALSGDAGGTRHTKRRKRESGR